MEKKGNKNDVYKNNRSSALPRNKKKIKKK